MAAGLTETAYTSSLRAEDLRYFKPDNVIGFHEKTDDLKLVRPMIWALDLVERILDSQPVCQDIINLLSTAPVTISTCPDSTFKTIGSHHRYSRCIHEENTIQLSETLAVFAHSKDHSYKMACSFLIACTLLHELGNMTASIKLGYSCVTYEFDRTIFGGQIIHEPRLDFSVGHFILRYPEEVSKMDFGIVSGAWIQTLYEQRALPESLQPTIHTHAHIPDDPSFPGTAEHTTKGAKKNKSAETKVTKLKEGETPKVAPEMGGEYAHEGNTNKKASRKQASK